jgi:uncharacterized coiled-coil protein SlyX
MIRSDDNDARRDASRIDELEARLAQQDQSLLELGDEVYRQQRQIAELGEKLRVLTQRIEALTSREPTPGSLDEIPPHY